MKDNKDRPLDIVLAVLVFTLWGVLLAWRG